MCGSLADFLREAVSSLMISGKDFRGLKDKTNRKIEHMNAPVKRHTQGLRLVKLVLQEQSWDILTENQIRDEFFYADSKVCINFIRKYQSEYNELPPVDLVEEQVKVKFPSEVARQYAVNDFIKYKATKEIQRAVLSVKDNAISDPFQCLADLKRI